PETSVFPLVTQEPPRRKRRWALPIVIILALIALVVGVGVVAIQTGWVNIKPPAAEEPHDEAEVVVSPVEENSSESGDAGDKADDDSDEPFDGSDESDDDDNKDEESEQRHEAVEESDDDETKSSDAKQSRARSVASEERKFTVVRAGTSATSDAFARQVHSAFVNNYESTGRTFGSITAYSPVTQMYYSMDCRDRGSYVVCTGGNNAVVYIS